MSPLVFGSISPTAEEVKAIAMSVKASAKYGFDNFPETRAAWDAVGALVVEKLASLARKSGDDLMANRILAMWQGEKLGDLNS